MSVYFNILKLLFFFIEFKELFELLLCERYLSQPGKCVFNLSIKSCTNGPSSRNEIRFYDICITLKLTKSLIHATISLMAQMALTYCTICERLISLLKKIVKNQNSKFYLIFNKKLPGGKFKDFPNMIPSGSDQKSIILFLE